MLYIGNHYPHHLKPNRMYRIVKKPRGYIVEVKTYKWTLFGLKTVWKPFVKTSGMDCAWHHKTHQYAMDNLISEVKNQIE